jgi:hypothetical protein
VRGAHPRHRGTHLLELGQEEGAPKRGGALAQDLHQTSQAFFKEGASTSGQRQRHLKAKHLKAKAKSKVKRLRA